ncbi:MAG: hypothetical protein U0936_24890 [Planctomycetaceae bacterium]
MLARLWGKMIWLYGRFSQKLAEFGGGIVPRQGWSAAEAYKEPIFTGFRLDNRLWLIGNNQREIRKILSERF